MNRKNGLYFNELYAGKHVFGPVFCRYRRREMRQMTSICLGVILVLAAFTATAHSAATVTQTFDLHPGWNAIYIEAQPDPADPASVFSGMPEIESVWTRSVKVSSAEFIDDPANGLENKPGWLVYYSSEDAVLSTMKSMRVNKAYLVKLNGAVNRTLIVTGTPKVQSQDWITDSFNFVGFHLDPLAPPTFEAFMAPSDALKSRIAYRLGADGKWAIIDNPALMQMKAGEAYWMFAEGASKYSGPLNVEIDKGQLLFNKNLTRKTVKLTNLSGNDKSVTLRLSPAFPDKLVYPVYNPSGFPDYIDINSMPPVVLKAGKSYTVTIMMQTQKTPATLDAILTISDSEGVRIQAPVSVVN